MDRFLTLAELYARSGGATRVQQLAPPESGGSSAAAIAAAITSAEEEAASYLSTRYPTQLPATAAATPEVLKLHVAAAALYHLARAAHDVVSAEIRAGYDDALSWYRSVAGGRANLSLATAPAVDRSAPQILASRTTSDMVFANGGLDEW